MTVKRKFFYSEDTQCCYVECPIKKTFKVGSVLCGQCEYFDDMSDCDAVVFCKAHQFQDGVRSVD